MYTITKQTEKELKSWIEKIPDSIVKSQIINLFAEVYPTDRMTPEQLEKFLSYQHNLPIDFQSYPQTFAQVIKNQHDDTKDVLADSHDHLIPEKHKEATGEQKQEILHTLNVTDKTLTGTKTDATHEIEKPEEKPVKMKGNKTEQQVEEEKSIIARNKDADTAPKSKEKPKTIIVKQKPTSKKKK